MKLAPDLEKHGAKAEASQGQRPVRAHRAQQQGMTHPEQQAPDPHKDSHAVLGRPGIGQQTEADAGQQGQGDQEEDHRQILGQQDGEGRAPGAGAEDGDRIIIHVSNRPFWSFMASGLSARFLVLWLLRGLQALLDPSQPAQEKIADVYQTIRRAEQVFGGLEALPFSEVMPHIAAYRGRVRSRRRPRPFPRDVRPSRPVVRLRSAAVPCRSGGEVRR